MNVIIHKPGCTCACDPASNAATTAALIDLADAIRRSNGEPSILDIPWRF